jgi:S1-C subfamily serine protease
MNIADILVILCLIAFLVRGVELGFIQQIFSTTGFIGGMFAGAFLQHHFVQDVVNENSRALLSLLIVLGTACMFLFIGELVGGTLKLRLHAIDKPWLRRTDKAAGSALAGATLLIVVWLISGAAGNLPNKVVQDQIKNSYVIQQLKTTLPDAPKTLSRIGRLINPNGFPKVFIGQEPALDTTTPLPELGDMQAGVAAARPSVVKISGRGCGGIVTGSGFIASNGLVITNAHVIAGVDQSTIIDSSGSHDARPVWFDPNLDIAILASDELAGEPLPLIAQRAANGSAAAALGFPGGGDFTVSPSTILDSFIATGRNIYEEGQTERSVYSLKSEIHPGNSGGPLINAKGQVIGVIFAQSTAYDQVGYALTMDAIIDEVTQAASGDRQAVGTGSCSAG